MKRSIAVLFFVITVLSGALVSQASALTLTDLVTGGQSITQGDKLFSNFTATDFTAADLASVSVEGITTATGENGLRFSTTSSANTGETFISTLDYRVTVLDPNFLIHDVTGTLTTTGFTGTGSLTGAIIFSPGSVDPVNLTVTAGTPSASIHTDLQANTSILLVHNVFTDVGPESSTLLTFDQTFSQVPVRNSAVPEPATVVLVATGLGSLYAYRRFRGFMGSVLESQKA